jgi:hypothetical protein
MEVLSEFALLIGAPILSKMQGVYRDVEDEGFSYPVFAIGITFKKYAQFLTCISTGWSYCIQIRFTVSQ